MMPPSLEQLRDIHLPPQPVLASLLPEAWGGWLGAGGLTLLAAGLWWSWCLVNRRRQRAAYRQLACLAADHARDGDTTRLVGGLSRLLRHYAASRFPHAGVEGLTGAGWLDFLDRHGGGGAFSGGVGTVLAWRPYRNHGEVDAAALVALVRRWLQANPQ